MLQLVTVLINQVKPLSTRTSSTYTNRTAWGSTSIARSARSPTINVLNLIMRHVTRW